METPDQRLFEDDLLSAEFRSGVLKGFWDVAAPSVLPAAFSMAHPDLWMAAAARPNAPERFYIQLDLSGYRTAAPTGTFWDPGTKSVLDLSKRPKGKAGEPLRESIQNRLERRGSVLSSLRPRCDQRHPQMEN